MNSSAAPRARPRTPDERKGHGQGHLALAASVHVIESRARSRASSVPACLASHFARQEQGLRPHTHARSESHSGSARRYPSASPATPADLDTFESGGSTRSLPTSAFDQRKPTSAFDLGQRGAESANAGGETLSKRFISDARSARCCQRRHAPRHAHASPGRAYREHRDPTPSCKPA